METIPTIELTKERPRISYLAGQEKEFSNVSLSSCESMLKIETDKYAQSAESTFTQPINYTYIDANFTTAINNVYVEVNMMLGLASIISRFSNITDYSLSNVRFIEYEINLKNYIMAMIFKMQQLLLGKINYCYNANLDKHQRCIEQENYDYIYNLYKRNVFFLF